MSRVNILQILISNFGQGYFGNLQLVFFYELLGNGSVQGLFPIIAVGIAYGTSFLSRRLLIERHVESSLALGLVSALMALVYLLLLTLWRDATISVLAVFGNMLLSGLLFPLVFMVLRIREERIRFSLMSEFRGMRT